ncbi:transposase family protein [Amycolatopsis sp. MEPSY49]|uniref:transposase family protein n=1 Tax=Amycolatopsis sp. MEPSY49 TaxID=3151600 RepID=UPI003F514889
MHLWYSGKHRAFGGNVQFLASPDGFPLWISAVLPGSRNDLSAARDHDIVGALTAAAAGGLPTLADRAYHAAGIGIHTPVEKAAGQPPPAPASGSTTCCSPEPSANAPWPSSKHAGEPGEAAGAVEAGRTSADRPGRHIVSALSPARPQCGQLGRSRAI